MSEERKIPADFQAKLRIDVDDLDTALVEQPDLFYRVAEAFVQAVALRDRIKLELEQVTAEEDHNIRVEAAKKEEKITEASIQQRLRTVKVVMDLSEDALDTRTRADSWLALKEAFHQRSFMLRELVQRQISQLQSLGVERGAAGSRAQLAEKRDENNREIIGRSRGAEPRFRPTVGR